MLPHYFEAPRTAHRGSRPSSGFPFPALLPFQVLHYPIPQIIPRQPPTLWQDWPGSIDPAVLRWNGNLDTLSSAGDQLYVHVPFCPFYCHFCPLYKTKDARHRNEDTKEHYIATLLKEIKAYGSRPELQDKTFRTLYFGGGTPTQLTPAQLGWIVDCIRSCFSLDPEVEITLEGVATQMIAPGYLEACLERGFNRISFGVQSLDPVVRQKIGRGERPRDYDRLIELVRDLGVGLPLNADLMIGLPGQDLESHDRDITAILEWGVGSVDVYSYWMVPGTRLFDNVIAGRRQPPRYGETMLEMRRHGKARLLDNGFRQVSGEAYARSDRDVFMQTTFGGGGSGLNTLVGFGPSAIGFIEGTLYQNIADLEMYMKSVESGQVPVRAAERISVSTARRRAIMLGLQRLNVPRVLLGAREKRIFRGWARQGLVELHDDVFHLTSEGTLWYNQMQLSLLSMAEQRKLIGLLGTPQQQMVALSMQRPDPDGPTEQLLALIRNEGGLAGQLRVLGYKIFLHMKALPLFDDRAMGFGGYVSQSKESEK
jgi:coproporphyrinogen III oxidase-like Fe-S oxidoreductase